MSARFWATLTFAWSVVFALPNFAWAAGNDTATTTIAADADAALGWGADSWALALTGAAKLAIGFVAVAAAFSEERWLRRLVLVIGAGLLLYGAANMVQHALFVAGVVEVPESLGERAARWHLYFWDPIWLLGGLLFLLTGWRTGRDRVEWPEQSLTEETTS
jgi:hypothetical protein